MKSKVQIQGYVTGLDENKDVLIKAKIDSFFDEGIANTIKNLVINRSGVKSYSDYKKCLGRDINIIDDCSLRLYFTDTECSLEDADVALLSKLEGSYYSDISLVGYSEYTITGYDVKKCQIGGHDLLSIIANYIGKYMILVMEW